VETGQALDHQPRSGVHPKKSRRDRLIHLAAQHPDWRLGFADEVWWSRQVQPNLHTWTEVHSPLRLVEQRVASSDPDPKALACYGVLLRPQGLATSQDGPESVWLRFVARRPVSAITIQFLAWCCTRLEQQRVPVWVLIWDNASWHISKAVRFWIRAHNQTVKRTGVGVRLLVNQLPIKSPWLNPIEPKWVHGKRAIVEPTRLLSADELADRICAYFACSHEPYLSIPDKVA
jgi:transposase